MKPRYDLVVPLSVQEVPMDWPPKLPEGSPWWGVLLLPMAAAAPAAWRRVASYLSRRAQERADVEKKKLELAAEARARRDADNTARQRRQNREYDKDRPILVQQLERVQEQAEKLLNERDRALANETWLREENAQYAKDVIHLKERLDDQDAELAADREERRQMRIEIQECHAQRDLDAAWARDIVQWVLREFTPKNAATLSQPPRRRSITPADMPAIPKAPVLKIELDDFFERKEPP